MNLPGVASFFDASRCLQRFWDRDFAQHVDISCQQDFMLSGNSLMERAGWECAQFLRAHFDRQRKILLLAGPGNNGGDGLVMARHLWEWGYHLSIILCYDKTSSRCSKLQQEQLRVLKLLGAEIHYYRFGYLNGLIKSSPWDHALVVDAVLGMGMRGNLGPGIPRDALEECQRIFCKNVIAIDVPSGLSADEWDPDEPPPLTADFCLSFGGYKPCHLLAPSRTYCGEVKILDIGFLSAAQNIAATKYPPQLYYAQRSEVLKQASRASQNLNINKYDRGHVLVIGGSEGKQGAPRLSAYAALRSGAGWASLAVEYMEEAIDDDSLELTTEVLWKDSKFLVEDFLSLIAHRKVKALVIGPGWTSSLITPEFYAALVAAQQKYKVAIVFDAGALAGIDGWIKSEPLDPKRTVVTPHPGEWKKMGPSISCLPRKISNLSEVQSLCQQWGCTLVYKSATPLVISPKAVDQNRSLAVTDNSPRLARAGSGDVLAGIIATHLAAGYEADAASIRSLILLEQAARQASMRVGDHGVLATDIIKELGFWGV